MGPRRSAKAAPVVPGLTVISGQLAQNLRSVLDGESVGTPFAEETEPRFAEWSARLKAMRTAVPEPSLAVETIVFPPPLATVPLGAGLLDVLPSPLQLVASASPDLLALDLIIQQKATLLEAQAAVEETGWAAGPDSVGEWTIYRKLLSGVVWRLALAWQGDRPLALLGQ